jgi:hypothetical protein
MLAVSHVRSAHGNASIRCHCGILARTACVMLLFMYVRVMSTFATDARAQGGLFPLAPEIS